MLIRILTLTCCLLLASRALAESEAIRIVYRADPGCPSQREFERAVLGRTAKAHITAEPITARVFEIELVRSGPQVTGSLVIHEQDGATVARRIRAADCSEVAKVLALGAALAIDPRAELTPSESPESETPATIPAAESPLNQGRDPSPSSRGASQARDTSQPPDANPPRTKAPVRDVAEPALAQEPIVIPQETRRRPYAAWAWQAAAGARGALGIAPRAVFGAAVSVGVAQHTTERPFALDVTGIWSATLPASGAGAGAEFRFLAARPRACLFAFQAAFALRLGPCLAAELGSITARGSDLPRTKTQIRFWAAAELGLRGDLTLGGAWFTSLDVSALLPITRYRYVFEQPETSVYAIPTLAGGASLNVGARY